MAEERTSRDEAALLDKVMHSREQLRGAVTDLDVVFEHVRALPPALKTSVVGVMEAAYDRVKTAEDQLSELDELLRIRRSVRPPAVETSEAGDAQADEAATPSEPAPEPKKPTAMRPAATTPPPPDGDGGLYMFFAVFGVLTAVHLLLE